jgi:pilus assembly protein CpaC
MRRSCKTLPIQTFIATMVGVIVCAPVPAFGQLLSDPAINDKVTPLETPSRVAIEKEKALIREIYDPELLLRVEPAQSKIIKTNFPVARTAISHPDIVDIQVFGENEIEIIGNKVGETTMTFWFDIPNRGQQVLRYYVIVDNAKQEQRRREIRYKELQSRVNELFPNSQVFLFPIDDKVIVRGQARDSQEATEIMRILGGGNFNNANRGFNNFNNLSSGFGGGAFLNGGADNGNAADNNFDNGNTDNFINMLQVPGEQQVMLKVRVAELIRDSSRSTGADITTFFDSFQLSHLISGGGNLTAILDDGDVQFFLRAIASHSYGKILAEPTLVTISGKTANFLAGGEFAVPTSLQRF